MIISRLMLGGIYIAHGLVVGGNKVTVTERFVTSSSPASGAGASVVLVQTGDRAPCWLLQDGRR
jgi:hypothetical protein